VGPSFIDRRGWASRALRLVAPAWWPWTRDALDEQSGLTQAAISRQACEARQSRSGRALCD